MLTVGSIPVSMVDKHSAVPAELIASVLLFVPFLALLVRRLRDAGFPWVMVLLLLVPVLGQVAVVIITLLASGPDAGTGDGSS